jgi:tetraacyldisaccharide 4'-kinase
VKLKKPHFWDYKEITLISLLLLPFTIPILLRNLFVKFNNKVETKIKTICVGNIYLGGTGKTSFTIKLNEILRKLKFKTAIIKKYYSDQIDEQKILNNKKLYSYKKRIEAVREAIKDKNEVAIFDDGLQEVSLNYDLTFVCFNIENWIGNGFLLPAGPLRESISSLKNYKAVVLTGNNENTFFLKKKIKKYNKKIRIFEAIYKPTNLKKIKSKKNYLVFSGIGNPKTFEKTLLINKIKIIKSIVFPDHYQYSNEDIKKIKKKAKKLNAKILTTEKDYLRLNNNNKKNINFLKIKFLIKNEKKLIQFLKSHL